MAAETPFVLAVALSTPPASVSTVALTARGAMPPVRIASMMRQFAWMPASAFFVAENWSLSRYAVSARPLADGTVSAVESSTRLKLVAVFPPSAVRRSMYLPHGPTVNDGGAGLLPR